MLESTKIIGDGRRIQLRFVPACSRCPPRERSAAPQPESPEASGWDLRWIRRGGRLAKPGEPTPQRSCVSFAPFSEYRGVPHHRELLVTFCSHEERTILIDMSQSGLPESITETFPRLTCCPGFFRLRRFRALLSPSMAA